MIISQVLVKFRFEKHIAKWRGAIVNASALALFGEKASLPGAILSVFLIIFLLLIGLKPRKKPQNESGV